MSLLPSSGSGEADHVIDDDLDYSKKFVTAPLAVFFNHETLSYALLTVTGRSLPNHSRSREMDVIIFKFNLVPLEKQPIVRYFCPVLKGHFLP